MLALDLIKISRQKHLKLIENLNIEQLNKIPKNFSNNLIWNFTHVVVTPELLCLKLAGLPFSMSETIINNYKKGTKPPRLINNDEIALIKNEALRTITHLEKLFKNSSYITYKQPYLTSYGVTLTNSDDALLYCSMHEAAHFNFSKALLKFV